MQLIKIKCRCPKIQVKIQLYYAVNSDIYRKLMCVKEATRKHRNKCIFLNLGFFSLYIVTKVLEHIAVLLNKIHKWLPNSWPT